MKNIVAALVFCVFMALGGAFAEGQAAYPEAGYLPEGITAQNVTDAMRVYATEDTGEKWTIIQSESACQGTAEIPWDGTTAIDDVIIGRWPEAWILKSADGEALFLDISMAGRCVADDGKIVVSASFGEFRSEERMLTAGAIEVMALYRPQAVISEVELDSDDGMLIFEGDAYVEGVEYEFELDAHTGRLLEWERD